MNFNEIAGRIESMLAAHSVTSWEISLISSRSLSIEVKEGKVDLFRAAEPVGVNLRVLKEGGMGFSYSTSLEREALERMVQSALTAAAFQTPDPCHSFAKPAPYPQLSGLFDEKLALVPQEEKIALALSLERLTCAADPRIRRVRKASYGEGTHHVFIRNSEGVEGSYDSTSVTVSVSAVAEENGDSQMGWDYRFSPRFDGVSVEDAARGAAARATALLGAGAIPTMRCPAVLDRYVAAEILEVLTSSFLADNVRKGKSLLAGKLGEKIVSDLLVIRDDGTLVDGGGTAPFDAEGTPQQNTVVVEGGRLATFLHDTLSACHDGTVSTGNAASGGIKSPPKPGITNFFIEQGTTPVSALFAGIERGILITDVMGIHTANPISGDFSVGASGFLVEKGMVTVPVKGIAIAGNILDLFSSVEGVGDDLRFYGGIGAPSLKIAALDVSGT